MAKRQYHTTIGGSHFSKSRLFSTDQLAPSDTAADHSSGGHAERDLGIRGDPENRPKTGRGCPNPAKCDRTHQLELAMIADRIQNRSIPEPNSGCWLWLDSLTKAGYGRININKKQYYSHILSYQCEKGPIPYGLVIDHLCRNPCCCNPDHLEAVTQAENITRGAGPPVTKARFAAMTHFKKCGHPITPENNYAYFDSKQSEGPGEEPRGRRCRICEKAAALARYYKRKQNA